MKYLGFLEKEKRELQHRWIQRLKWKQEDLASILKAKVIVRLNKNRAHFYKEE